MRRVQQKNSRVPFWSFVLLQACLLLFSLAIIGMVAELGYSVGGILGDRYYWGLSGRVFSFIHSNRGAAYIGLLAVRVVNVVVAFRSPITRVSYCTLAAALMEIAAMSLLFANSVYIVLRLYHPGS